MKLVKHILKITQVLLSTYYAYMLEYRAELILWALAGSLPLILMGVWVKASATGQFGLEPVEFARYFLLVFLVRQFTVVWVIWEFEREVVEGKLSPVLLQPIDPVWRYVASHVSERLARIPFVGLLMILFFILYPQALWIPQLNQVILFAIAVSLAFALRFLIQYTFSLLAFWIERVSAIEQFWFLLYLFLSGTVAPLEVLPAGLRAILAWTPFPYLVHFPAAILMGLPVNILQGFAAILGWGILFFIVNRWLWRKGLKRYSGMGA